MVTGKELKGEVLDRFSRRGGVIEASIEGKVKEIVSAVKSRRDEALLEYTKEFDGVDLSGIGFRVEGREVAEAYERLSEKELSALKKAAGNIKSFHEAQLCNKLSIETVSGVQAGQLFRPLSTVGIYAPGGRAVYPSTVLMCSIPAKVAGVERLVLCSPPNKNGEINPAVLVAADIAGVDEVFKVGGAQAVAAMAYRTGSTMVRLVAQSSSHSQDLASTGRARTRSKACSELSVAVAVTTASTAPDRRRQLMSRATEPTVPVMLTPSEVSVS